MFVKETRVKRKSGRVVTYLQLVSSYWDKERKTPRHKVLCSLGRLENLDKGRIQDLVDQLSSYLDEPKVASDGLLKVGETLEFGIPYLVEGVWKILKLDGFFQEELKKRKYEKPVHQALGKLEQKESEKSFLSQAILLDFGTFRSALTRTRLPSSTIGMMGVHNCSS